MNKISLIYFLLCFYFNLTMGQDFGKNSPLGFYPEQYKELNDKDWGEIKSILNMVLNFKDLDALLNDSNIRFKAWFLFSRISDISWPEEQKRIVAIFLKDFYSLTINCRILFAKQVDFRNFPCYSVFNSIVFRLLNLPDGLSL